MTLADEWTPQPGVTMQHWTTTSPTTNTWVARVDLCAADVHVDATRAATSRQSTGGWAEDEGVQLASNGDFYRTDPVLRVYGDAVGRGLRWPLEQTGVPDDYSWEWFFGNYGWIAFGPDWVEFTHTGWVNDNLTTSQGVDREPPSGTLALVSGFPELVTEGTVRTCADPTDDSCFPDRGDMQDRHPRTAMGLTEDRQTFLLVTVDGRTSASSGMRGAELADVMGQLGAWQAFNVDGGGSSQLWVEGEGYVNDHSGNNGGGTRSVANHWGVFAGGVHPLRPARAGHCVGAAPCGVIPPEGGVVDDQGGCFQAFGPAQYWREEPVGEGGHLFWTNAFASDQASNWAWWQLHFEDAGEYLVEYRAEPEFAVFDAVPYVIRAGGVSTDVVVDQTGADGWTEIGAFTFAAGGDQWVALFDNVATSPGSDQHVVADAIRLTRLDLPKGDDDDDDDSGVSDDDDSAVSDDDDSVASDDDDASDLDVPDGGGWQAADAGCCGGSEPADSAAVVLIPLLFGLRRRVRPAACS